MDTRGPIRVTRVVGRALEAARRALRDLDAKQIPASLRKVVAHSGDLTPPLANLLVRELGSLAWLREKALEAWPEADVGGEAPDRASALFLRRPPGWEIDLALEASALGASTALGGSGRLERERAALERDLAVARERERQARTRVEAAESEARQLRRRAARPVRADRSEAARLAEERARERALWEAERVDLISRAEAAEAGVADLRESLYRVERDRAEAARRLEEVRGGATWAARDPVALGAHLDHAAAQARSPRQAPPEPPASPFGSVVLPAGVRPDEARAVDAVLAHRAPLLIVVDGYNAAMRLAPGTPSEVRARLGNVLDRLVIVAHGGVRVSVVWDSSLDEGSTRRRGRFEERFSEPGESADDVVVSTARDSETSVVVFSSDRQVRDRAEAVGALALWADALVDWGAGRR
jgi:hypothetical protein